MEPGRSCCHKSDGASAILVFVSFHLFLPNFGGCEQVPTWSSLSLSLGFRVTPSESTLVASRQEDPAGGLRGTSLDAGEETGAARNRRLMDGLDTPVPWAQTSMHSVPQSHLRLKKLFKGCQMSKGRMHSLGNYQSSLKAEMGKGYAQH